MDYSTFFVIYTIFFSGLTHYEEPDSHGRIEKNTKPASSRIYKPINMDNNLEFANWSDALSSDKVRTK